MNWIKYVLSAARRHSVKRTQLVLSNFSYSFLNRLHRRIRSSKGFSANTLINIPGPALIHDPDCPTSDPSILLLANLL